MVAEGGNGKESVIPEVGVRESPLEEQPKPAVEIKAQPPVESDEFKICEIWYRKGRLMLDASPKFFAEKIRAYGIFDMCKDIVRDTKMNEGFRTWIPNRFRNFLNRKKR